MMHRARGHEISLSLIFILASAFISPLHASSDHLKFPSNVTVRKNALAKWPNQAINDLSVVLHRLYEPEFMFEQMQAAFGTSLDSIAYVPKFTSQEGETLVEGWQRLSSDKMFALLERTLEQILITFDRPQVGIRTGRHAAMPIVYVSPLPATPDGIDDSYDITVIIPYDFATFQPSTTLWLVLTEVIGLMPRLLDRGTNAERPSTPMPPLTPTSEAPPKTKESMNDRVWIEPFATGMPTLYGMRLLANLATPYPSLLPRAMHQWQHQHRYFFHTQMIAMLWRLLRSTSDGATLFAESFMRQDSRPILTALDHTIGLDRREALLPASTFQIPSYESAKCGLHFYRFLMELTREHPSNRIEIDATLCALTEISPLPAKLMHTPYLRVEDLPSKYRIDSTQGHYIIQSAAKNTRSFLDKHGKQVDH